VKGISDPQSHPEVVLPSSRGNVLVPLVFIFFTSANKLFFSQLSFVSTKVTLLGSEVRPFFVCLLTLPLLLLVCKSFSFFPWCCGFALFLTPPPPSAHFRRSSTSPLFPFFLGLFPPHCFAHLFRGGSLSTVFFFPL